MKIKTYEIIPNKLYQRGNLLNITYNKKVELIKELNIGFIVGLARESDTGLELIHKNGLAVYSYYPISDGKLPRNTIETLYRLAETALIFINNGESVLTYCNAGRNRSSLLSALIVMEVLGISGNEAIDYMREKRPNALANSYFVKYLYNLERI